MKYFICSVVILTVCFSMSLAAAQNKVVVVPLNSAKKLNNLVTVSAKGGDFTDPVAAVNSIDASADNPYLVLIGPGVYELTQTLVMKPYVSIAGSGRDATTLRGVISPGPDGSVILVSGADNATLYNLNLEIENTGIGGDSIALYNKNSSPVIHDVTATASGGDYSYGVNNYYSSPSMTDVTAAGSGGIRNYGVHNISSSPSMTDVTATGYGGTRSYGVYNVSSSPSMTDVTATGSGGTRNYGVYNSDNSSSQSITNVIATASGGSGTRNYGVYNSSSSQSMTNVIATASGGDENYGVYNHFYSSPSMTNVIATASGGYSYGVYNQSYSSPTIRRCTLSGSTAAIYHSEGTTRIMHSSVIGNVIVVNGGTLICVYVDDGNFVLTCP